MNKNVNLLTTAQVEEFHCDGVLIIKSFYDITTEIEPIQYAIYNIINILIKKYHLSIEQLPFSSATFDSGYQELIAYDRQIGGEVYDAIKQIPAFIRLVASSRHDAIFSQLRQTDLPGIAAAGYGIRIDNPYEEKYRAPWHQDYPAQFRSLDGLVFWSSLVPVTSSLGPVEFCTGSHKDGLVPVYTKDANNSEKSGAYALTIINEASLIASYPHISPLTQPGDLIVIDFLTLHRSGLNMSQRSRWSMQMRYFNFTEPTGIKIGWKGAFASGVNVEEVHPELFCNN
ncbi:phytanoyl-CoA dioxygenase family protein [Chamaesiphon minutus]|uniref:Protein involved in biosynthesis of mitomycin antibiotics/polyketide fumonisin n=1 Tax=Chamaesiphon minutus (strain ATCC 27169 / PCC 6605) TaxID=1173020 RepID=K9UKD5_CHAP6|nr:phytanoyl-CoA dioxygenase family protein [Chamaesiphon minutus]AFY94664.1 protein involved in biosynthesis of mitomycin antibiotics/polyketide fumonisin [Chamaesiphon minutus PCC 6605]